MVSEDFAEMTSPATPFESFLRFYDFCFECQVQQLSPNGRQGSFGIAEESGKLWPSNYPLNRSVGSRAGSLHSGREFVNAVDRGSTY